MIENREPNANALSGSIGNLNESHPYWDDIVSRDGQDAEPHLNTVEGRFNAFLNVANNGAKILELIVLTESFETYSRLNSSVNRAAGVKVCGKSATIAHLSKSLSPIGAVARADHEGKEWARTAFGTAIIPPLIYFSEAIQHFDINPSSLLGAFSRGRKELGETVSSVALDRARTLISLSLNNNQRLIDIANKLGLTINDVTHHLKALSSIGLANYESADTDNPVTQYSITQKGWDNQNWGIFSRERMLEGKKIVTHHTKGSKSVRKALSEMFGQSRSFTTVSQVTEHILQVTGDKCDKYEISMILKFFAEEGFLTQSNLHEGNFSNVEITEEGHEVARVLNDIAAYFEDPDLVPEIVEIKNKLGINSGSRAPVVLVNSIDNSSPGLIHEIAQRYTETSPTKNKPGDVHLSHALQIIQKHGGEFATSEVARICGIPEGSLRSLLEPYIEAGLVIRTMRLNDKGKRYGSKMYLSISH